MQIAAKSARDVVVIGGGINGAATAYYLAALGAGTITVLAGSHYQRSASSGSVGLLRTHHDNVPEAALAAASMPIFAGWSDVFGTPNGWLSSGFARFVGEDEVEALRTNVEIQRALGVNVELLDPAEIAHTLPQFDLSGLGAAAYEPDAGTADAWKCTRSLLAAAERCGAVISRTDAARILVDGAGVSGVETADRRTIPTRVVVLAAGAWSKKLAATAGVDLPLESRAITVGEIELPDSLRVVSSYMDPVTDSWLAPRSGVRGIISIRDRATGAAADPDAWPEPVSTDCYAEGVARVAARLPSLANARVLRAWTLLDTYAPDGKPVLGGVHELAGLYLNIAGAGKGHKVAPAIGLSLSEAIIGEKQPTVNIDVFGLQRFASGGFPVSGAAYARKTIG